MLIYQGPSFYLKFLVKKGLNSKNIAFRVLPPCLSTAPCIRNRQTNKMYVAIKEEVYYNLNKKLYKTQVTRVFFGNMVFIQYGIYS